jgi:RNA polymerase sigma-70 factor (ECF subfamily)
MEASPALTSAQRAPAAERKRRAADRALEKLYDRHARDVYQYALALLANPADAEDATQTTFLNAYRALLHGDRPHRPHNWLITITHNVCRMRWRQAGHRPREVALEEAPEPVALERERPDLAQLLNALGQLTFNQRAALVMRELEGRSCKEIAATLEVSVSSVEALLFRARRHLQLERGSLGILTTAPFPATKLLSALGIGGGGGGSAAAAGGAAAVGADLAVKAVALVAVGAIVTGAIGVATQVRRLGNAAPAKVQAASIGGVVQTARRAKARPAHRALPVHRTTPTQTQPPAPTGATTAARPTGTASAQAPAPTQAPSLQLPSIQVPSVQVPQLPVPLPQVQLPPVQLPPVQLPQLPVQLPVQLPQLPTVPPLPPLNP